MKVDKISTMTTRTKTTRTINTRGISSHTIGILLILTVSGCSTVDLSTDNPTGVDLSGTWVVDFKNSDVVPDLRNHMSKKTQKRIRRGTNASRVTAIGSGLSFIRHDFQVLSATQLEIEQNKDSMGVQHLPGVYRDISWGERQRGLWAVNAGWEGRELVVISSANKLRVEERYSVFGGGRLLVNIQIDADDEEFSFRRQFARRQ